MPIAEGALGTILEAPNEAERKQGRRSLQIQSVVRCECEYGLRKGFFAFCTTFGAQTWDLVVLFRPKPTHLGLPTTDVDWFAYQSS